MKIEQQRKVRNRLAPTHIPVFSEFAVNTNSMEMMPRNNRERELASYWSRKGMLEASIRLFKVKNRKAI